MKFKIDENLPNEIAVLLSNAGFDALTVSEQNLKGTADSILLNVCRQENRVLITLDLDFTDIRTYPPQDYPGIIVMRVGRQSKPHVLEVFQSRNRGSTKPQRGIRDKRYLFLTVNH
ncbi:MAG: DUF5615 family PIN-like protein [bacterium]|nr:DUF5615 family PIN-like protein [bacterium]